MRAYRVEREYLGLVTAKEAVRQIIKLSREAGGREGEEPISEERRESRGRGPA